MAKIFQGMKGYAKYDKSAICLPWQVTKIALKTFENQGFFVTIQHPVLGK